MRFCLVVVLTLTTLFPRGAAACAVAVAQASGEWSDVWFAIAGAKAKHVKQVEAREASGVRQALLPEFRVPVGQPLGVTVVVHGYAQSPLAMRAIADYLREHRGQVVIDVLLEGHGYRDPQQAMLGTIASWRQNLDEALALAASIPLPLNTVAFSLGATLLLDAIRRNDRQAFHQVALVAPLVEISSLFQWLLGGREPDQFLSKHDQQPLSISGYNWALCVGLQRGMEVMNTNRVLEATKVRTNGLYVVTTESDRFISSASAQTISATGPLLALEHLPKRARVSHHGLLEKDAEGYVPAVEALRKLRF